MRIEILVFDGCPNSEPAEKLVRDTVKELGIDANIDIVNIAGHDDAVAKRFLGSPSIRIDGKDIEIEENELTQYSMRCRIYQFNQKTSGIPPKQVLIDRLRKAGNC
jgi:hypothetical protein